MNHNQIMVQLLHQVESVNDAQQGGAADLGNCRQCKRPLKRKSKNGRIPEFCSVNCRVANWRAKQREDRAGRAGNPANL